MNAKILDGKALAQKIKNKIEVEISKLEDEKKNILDCHNILDNKVADTERRNDNKLEDNIEFIPLSSGSASRK